MALIIEDRVLETSTSTGTGDFTLAGALLGYRAFSAVCATNDTFYYMIEAIDANGAPTADWEAGIGTYSAANTLTRTAVSRSSNSNVAVSFSAGAKRVAISAIAASSGTQALIAPEVITSSSQTSVTFSSITAIYRDLMVVVRGRGTAAALTTTIQLQFNSDTGANYQFETMRAGGSGSAFSQTTGQTAASINDVFPAATAPANFAGYSETRIYDYRGTTFFKTTNTRLGAHLGTTTNTNQAGVVSTQWNSTSAINTIKVLLSAGAFVDNTVVSLYGLV